MSDGPGGNHDDGQRDLGFRQFVWLWNRCQGQTTPALHLEIAAWLNERWEEGDRRLALLVFRNAGKSTLVGVFCAWLLLHEPDLRILVLAAEHDLARKMVRNVKRIIERHPLTRGLVPKRADQWAADQFTVARRLTRRDPSLLARGIAANITGSRADVVICDDVEVPNTSATPHRRAELRQRLREIEYVLMPGGLQLYVGTPHSYYSIYVEEARREIGEDAPFLAGYRRLCIPLLDRRGRSRWPERFPLDKIEEIRRHTGPAKFESQMLLRPRSIEDIRLDPDRLRLLRGTARVPRGQPRGDPVDRRPPHGLGDRLVGPGLRRARQAAMPAWSRRCLVDGEGGYWLHGVRYLSHDPALVGEVDEASQLCRQVARFAQAHYLPSITLETNGLGRFLPALLRRELDRLGYACAVVEHVSQRSKDQRILDAFDPLLAAGALHAHAGIWASGLIEEMREWRPGRRCRDDGLDAVSGCLLSEPVRLPRQAAGRRREWRPGRGLQAAAVDFQV